MAACFAAPACGASWKRGSHAHRSNAAWKRRGVAWKRDTTLQRKEAAAYQRVRMHLCVIRELGVPCSGRRPPPRRGATAKTRCCHPCLAIATPPLKEKKLHVCCASTCPHTQPCVPSPTPYPCIRTHAPCHPVRRHVVRCTPFHPSRVRTVRHTPQRRPRAMTGDVRLHTQPRRVLHLQPLILRQPVASRPLVSLAPSCFNTAWAILPRRRRP